ncbi:hypothetical protein EXIGLDRAFT_86124 [Exidia glandulosa HHB12029]|uniref:Uncharacterized protein n=1 Tax=Exidia glandulosa HHB12029 TaxID=1314781 RepID=A0A165HEM8_EXIGL|nr:hypothetical protein EXIGLDRAFT_86124 [Exidia glandulosa HHB12029]
MPRPPTTIPRFISLHRPITPATRGPFLRPGFTAIHALCYSAEVLYNDCCSCTWAPLPLSSSKAPVPHQSMNAHNQPKATPHTPLKPAGSVSRVQCWSSTCSDLRSTLHLIHRPPAPAKHSPSDVLIPNMGPRRSTLRGHGPLSGTPLRGEPWIVDRRAKCESSATIHPTSVASATHRLSISSLAVDPDPCTVGHSSLEGLIAPCIISSTSALRLDPLHGTSNLCAPSRNHSSSCVVPKSPIVVCGVLARCS